ncbi:class I SAM-dependent methyltransferase [Tepidimonas charontis]|uniref:Methyltransferase domain protein n=1 Tax=Tepidimonas charontis TaxID=2267262 RepID=A0A554X2C6_9BURK|nr:class I SAM-dependent methyltransferase [Tepidimonas charontis]TSE29974.1 Methyltransferase domain protein [Tepidimonas charontis]
MAVPYTNPGDALQLYTRVEKVPGYFNYDDAQHFQLVLRMQSLMGITGDLLEIGCWKGRSALFMSFFVQPRERLIISDVFSQPANDVYSEYPSVDEVKKNLEMNPNIASSQLLFLEGNSANLQLPPDVKLRFAHIDGGHSFQECYRDLITITPRMILNGVVVIDDYDHPDWPEVKLAADTWLKKYSQFRVLGELNRNVAKGKKIYLINIASSNQ